jgi:spore maturation protein CgeB
MKILIADIFLTGRSHATWKDGFVFYYALKNLGHDVTICGKNCEISEFEIPNIAHNYDLIIITENYPNATWDPWGPWGWWNWSAINVPKVFWAIDTHLVDFNNMIQYGKINHVAFNNKKHMDKIHVDCNKFYLPYGISRKHYDLDYNENKIHDISFIGGINQERKNYIDKYSIKTFQLFGEDYVREMQRSKICFNKSISDDLNAKNLEIIGSGTFMLSNFNSNFLDSMDNNEYINEMLYKDDEDLDKKIKYYLIHDNEREEISKKAREYIFKNHSYEKRSEYLLSQIK